MTAPLAWDIHVFKTQETKHPGTRQLNHANRKKKMNILQIGLGFLFIYLFFFTLPIARLAGVFRVPFRCFVHLRQRWPRDHYFSRHLFRLTAVTVCQQTTRKQKHFNSYFFHRFIIMELISRLTTQAFATLKVGKLNVFKKGQKISANVIVRVTAVSLNICCSTNYERCCSLFDK